MPGRSPRCGRRGPCRAVPSRRERSCSCSASSFVSLRSMRERLGPDPHAGHTVAIHGSWCSMRWGTDVDAGPSLHRCWNRRGVGTGGLMRGRCHRVMARPSTTGGAQCGKAMGGRHKVGHDTGVTGTAILTPMEPSQHDELATTVPQIALSYRSGPHYLETDGIADRSEVAPSSPQGSRPCGVNLIKQGIDFQGTDDAEGNETA